MVNGLNDVIMKNLSTPSEFFNVHKSFDMLK